MTDQTAHDVTDEDRRLARKWAAHIIRTPRTSLPMEAAAARVILNDTPAPALPEGWRLADHPDHGRVIVTNTTPDKDGNVHFVLPAVDPLGYDWFFCTPDRLTYIDTGQEADQ